MLKTEMYSISMAQMQRFFVAAEYNSFTKAAEKLYVTQSVISKSISALERTLQLILFIRERGTVRLSPAGRYFYDACAGMLLTFEQAATVAQTIQEGVSGQITVGVHNFYNLRCFFMPIVGLFRAQHPNYVVRTRSYSFSELRRKVLNGELDMAFTSRFEADGIRRMGSADLVVDDLAEFPLRAMMLRTNPLAERSSISVEDLRFQKFIMHSPTLVPAYHALITDMCLARGFLPSSCEYVDDAFSFTLSLSENNQVFVVDRAARVEEYLPLKGFDLKNTLSGVSMMWSKSCTNALLAPFLACARQFFADNPNPFDSGE